MTSLINTSAIDTTYPVAGQDNDTQGFRTNFGSIANNLSIAASEITTLQTGVAALAAFPAPTSEVFYPGTGIAGSKTFVSGSRILTLSGTYGTVSNIKVHFDGVYQGITSILTLVGNVLTFVDPIPVGVGIIYVDGGIMQQVSVPPTGSVGIGQLAPDALTYFQTQINEVTPNSEVFTLGTGSGKFQTGETSITLAGTYGTLENIKVHFGVAYLGIDQLVSLVGHVLTFVNPIPSGVSEIYIDGGSITTLGVPANASIGVAQLAPDTITYIQSQIGVNTNPTSEVFSVGTGIGTFQVGASSITLAGTYGSLNNIRVFFDAAYQGINQLSSLVGNVLTFAAPIPTEITNIYVDGGNLTVVGVPSNGTIGLAQLAPDALNYLSSVSGTAPTLAGPVTVTSTNSTNSIIVNDSGVNGANIKLIGNGSVTPNKFIRSQNGAFQVVNSTYTSAILNLDDCGNLSASTFNGNIPFTQSGTGAVARTVNAKLNESVSVLDFGADPTGVADSTAAIQSAVTSAISQNKKLNIPAGSFKITGNITGTLLTSSQAFAVQGDGSGLSKIIAPNNNGFVFNMISSQNALHIRGMSVIGGEANVGSAFLVNQTQAGGVSNPANSAQSDFFDIGIQGTSSSNFFGNGILISGASCFSFYSVNCVGNTSAAYAATNCGNGIVIVGTSSYIPVQFNIVNCTLQYLTESIYYGTYAQGIAVSDTNFTGSYNGIYSPSSAVGTDQLFVSGCQFNCANRGILVQNILVNLLINGNLFLVPDSAIGIDIVGAYLCSIIGNTFNYTQTGTNTNGIAIESTNGTTPACVISTNSFLHMTSGIWILSGATGVECYGNSFTLCSNNVYDQGINSILSLPFTQVGTGAVARTVNAKLNESVSVLDFGADPTGVADSTLAFSALATIQNSIVPQGTYLLNSIPTLGAGVIQFDRGVTLTGSGASSYPVNSPSVEVQFVQTAATSSDNSTLAIRRNASYAGGTAGVVSSAFRTDVYTSAGASNYEWGITSVMNNYATAGQNVAIYGQGNKETGAGPTWAGCFEARDGSGNSNPTTGLIGLEVDILANGTDSHNSRIGIDVVAGIGVGSTNAPVVSCGIRIGPQNGVSTNAAFLNGLLFNNIAVSNAVISMNPSAGSFGLQIGGSVVVGIDTTLASFSSGDAIRMSAGQAISFDLNSTVTVVESAGVLVVNGAVLESIKGFAIPSTGNISNTATAGSSALPTNPAGFMIIKIDSTNYKIPYYGN